jgi:hypothetical protein
LILSTSHRQNLSIFAAISPIYPIMKGPKEEEEEEEKVVGEEVEKYQKE